MDPQGIPDRFPARPLALVVEDEPVILMETADLLEEAGYEVLEKTTADAALRHLVEFDKVDLLVTDVQVPGKLDGCALARRVAQHWPEIVIVVLSGATTPTAADLPAKARFVRKPFSARALRAALSLPA